MAKRAHIAAPERHLVEVVVFGTVSLAILSIPVFDLLTAIANGRLALVLGVDYRLYMDATNRWLAGGTFYNVYQLTGPYTITPGDILYPPNALLFFAPATLLPDVLWWAIPLAIVAAVVWHDRPAPVLWPFIAICLAWPPTALTIAVGNPAMWVAAAVALGTIYAWPAVLVLLKPQLFPFALVGIRRSSWWIALAVLFLVSLAFLPMWVDWIAVVLNSRGGGLLYSVQQVPLLLVPLLAALPVVAGRSRQGGWRAVHPVSVDG